MKNRGRPYLYVIGVVLLFALSGCFYREPVRHLASDICLVTSGLTQREVLSLLGPPDYRRAAGREGETWVYFEARKSTLRKMPYVGEHLGRENYQVATVTFVGGEVRTCVYRDLTAEEFREMGIPEGGSLGE